MNRLYITDAEYSDILMSIWENSRDLEKRAVRKTEERMSATDPASIAQLDSGICYLLRRSVHMRRLAQQFPPGLGDAVMLFPASSIKPHMLGDIIRQIVADGSYQGDIPDSAQADMALSELELADMPGVDESDRCPHHFANLRCFLPKGHRGMCRADEYDGWLPSLKAVSKLYDIPYEEVYAAYKIGNLPTAAGGSSKARRVHKTDIERVFSEHLKGKVTIENVISHWEHTPGAEESLDTSAGDN